MKRLEEELKEALRRKEPSADFTARVMAKLATPAPPRKKFFEALRRMNFHQPLLHWAGAALAVCLLIGLAALRYQHALEVKREGEAAKAQVIRALHIASNKLNRAQRLVKNRTLAAEKSTKAY